MITRGKVRVAKPKVITSLTAVSNKHDPDYVPTCFSEAIRIPQWYKAEYTTLMHNQTWDLVPPNEAHNVIGCKWIFRVKLNPDGTIERHKARLVAQGFKQQYGIDFTQTFSPVIKPATIRTVLTIALSNGWSLRQLDVKNGFLNGQLTKIVHVKQPAGFVHLDYPAHHCLLSKSLYGLKQAPRAWFQQLSGYLLSQGFTQSKTYPSLFTFFQGSNTIYFLLYVDDIIVTRSSLELLNRFIAQLDAKFSLNDLGNSKFFLGIEVAHNATVSRYNTEAEYRALAFTAAEITWLQYILKDLCIALSSAPLVLCDNISATYLAHNPVLHSRTKYTAIDYHFVREKVLLGDLLVNHVPTQHQLADVFTKPLTAIKFLPAISNLCLLLQAKD
ncbi:transmembrane signal receptor [Lithospermum erythrorhizon]|uniref:Transmembrane signal receptor n=1 Tax=Lithospermum erythrorhizon TaxID=34254 RepID=A0AAV3S2N3_LITER